MTENPEYNSFETIFKAFTKANQDRLEAEMAVIENIIVKLEKLRSDVSQIN